MLRALIFDVDGTLADTESAHCDAFNHAFAEEGLDWHWDRAMYTKLLEVSGGKERIRHYWAQVQPGMTSIDAGAMTDTVQRLHDIKTAAYEQAVQDGAVLLRPGVLALIEEASRAGLPMAIATTTSPVNVGALLRKAIGSHWQTYFPVIEDGSTAPVKKPHPQVYLNTLRRLAIPASDALAFEDSGNGLRAAVAARLATVITPTDYTRHHDFTGALRVLPDLSGVALATLQGWHRSAG
jgi:HAD superfamily hydrolase (TIGR01509 family)